MIKRALLSVTDKSGLTELASYLVERGVELIASGGTRAHLSAAGIASVELAEYTGSPECLGGRVKTLHPKVFGGILADTAVHGKELGTLDMPLIDLVVVNLYRFQETVAAAGDDWARIIEAIDIGGPSLIRAAAKNHGRVTVLCNPEQYGEFQTACGAGDGDPGVEFRRLCAGAAYAHTRDYDRAISAWFERSPAEALGEPLAKLRYGENPHQAAAVHGREGDGKVPYRQHGGAELSYNNLLDLDAALEMTADLEGCAAAVIKHGNPCGAGFGETPVAALEAAWSSDPVSAFGSVIALSHPVDEAVAAFLAKKFIEVLAAPGYSNEARTLLAKKKKLRVLELDSLADWRHATRLRSVGPLLLVQESDRDFVPTAEWKHGAGPAPDEALLAELDRAWRLAKHAKSNAIVVWHGDKLLGAGVGQTSRVDSCRIAIDKAREHGHEPRGAVAASDAFFPFPDGLEILAEAGVRAIVQPGGSIRDDEVLERASALGVCVMLTGRRHFRH